MLSTLNWFGVPVVRSSLAYHILEPYGYKDYQSSIINAAPAGLKIVADGGDFSLFANYYHALKNKTIFVARAFTPGEKINQAASRGDDPKQAAKVWHDDIAPLVDMLPLAYWEVCNEPGREQVAWHGECHAECVRLAAASGFRVVVGNWAEGNPQMKRWGDPKDDWNAFMPALESVNEYGPGIALLGVHEYCVESGGTFLTQPYRVGRINSVYKLFVDGKGLTNVYTVLTEYGRDVPAWTRVSNLSPELYSQELTDPAVQKLYDDRVLARFIFTVDAHPSWQSFNIAGTVFDNVNSYLIRNKPEIFPPMPPLEPSEPPVEPPPVEPPVEPPVGENLITNPSFEDGYYKKGEHLFIPNGWEVSSSGCTVHSEIETHPPNVLDGSCSAKIWQSYETCSMSYDQEHDLEAGAEYELEANVKTWSTNNAQVGTPSQADIDVKLGLSIQGAVIWSQVINPRDAYGNIKFRFVAPANYGIIHLWAKPLYGMARNDVFWDKISLKKVGSPPDPPEPAAKVTPTAAGLNVRVGPGINYEKTGIFLRGEESTVDDNAVSSIGKTSSWIYVNAPNASGWCAAWYLKKA